MKKHGNHIKPLSVALVILLIVFGGLLLVRSSTNKDTADNINSAPDSTDYAPPTDKEQLSGDQQKEVIVNNTNSKTTNTAQIAIVDANQYDNFVEVRAFVSQTVQDGTCTITFTKDDYSIKKSVPAYADAASTPCISLSVPRDEFKIPGAWRVEVKYVSDSSEISGSSYTDLEIN